MLLKHDSDSAPVSWIKGTSFIFIYIMYSCNKKEALESRSVRIIHVEAKNRKKSTKTAAATGHFSKSALTVIICVKFGFQLLHLPLVSQQQRSVFFQRPHSILLLVFRHLLDERVLLIVGDSWKERNVAQSFSEEQLCGVITRRWDGECAPATLSLHFLISFSFQTGVNGSWHRASKLKWKLKSRRCQAKSLAPKQAISNKAICRAHIPLLFIQWSLIGTNYNWNKRQRGRLCDRRWWHVQVLRNYTSTLITNKLVWTW